MSSTSSSIPACNFFRVSINSFSASVKFGREWRGRWREDPGSFKELFSSFTQFLKDPFGVRYKGLSCGVNDDGTLSDSDSVAEEVDDGAVSLERLGFSAKDGPRINSKESMG